MYVAKFHNGTYFLTAGPHPVLTKVVWHQTSRGKDTNYLLEEKTATAEVGTWDVAKKA